MEQIKYFNLTKKAVAYKTSESWKNVPHVSFVYEANATEILIKFKNLNDRLENKLTINTLLIKILTEAIKVAPCVNSEIEYNSGYVSGKLTMKKEINISLPWLLENGEMITITLRDFGNKNLSEMQAYINGIKEKIKNCNIEIPLRQVCVENIKNDLKKGHFLKSVKVAAGAVTGKSKTPKCSKREILAYNNLPPEKKITKKDLYPGTITVSNIGSVYKYLKGTVTLLEIIPPQVFAVGIGAVQEKAGIINNNEKKEIGIINSLPLCLAFDHRALNFSDIIPFIKKLDYIFLHSELLNEWL